jgi:hypothetical protein
VSSSSGQGGWGSSSSSGQGGAQPSGSSSSGQGGWGSSSSSGQGGWGSSSSSGQGGWGSSSSSGGGIQCNAFPPSPVGSLSFCGGTGSSSSGGGIQCSNSVCDQAQNTFSADCDEFGCTCSVNFLPYCACTIDVPGPGCANCCPIPWVNP